MPKYIFNKDTLNYEVYTSSGKLKLAKGIAVFAASVAVAFLYIWLYTAVLGWDLPKTAFLKKTNARLCSNLELLNRQLDSDAEYLESLQSRDNDIYRSVFGMAEIPAEVRNAGFGGVNRYEYLKAIDRTGLMTRTERRLDILTKKAYLQSKPTLPDGTEYSINSEGVVSGVFDGVTYDSAASHRTTAAESG